MSLDTNSRNGMQRFQTIMHLGMGCFYLVVGMLVLFVKYFGTMELSSGLAYTLGTLMIIYGLFRVWRGIAALKSGRRAR